MVFVPRVKTAPFGTLIPLMTLSSWKFAGPNITCLSPFSSEALSFCGTAVPNSKLTPSPLNSCDGSEACVWSPVLSATWTKA